MLKNINAKITIEICSEIFARFGIPEYFVTDCGTQFTSQEFQNFLKSYGITSKFTAPYHPATNGQAERYVQILKNSLKAMLHDGSNMNIRQKVNQLLMQYRKMPHITTGKSPSCMLLRREIKTKIDKLIPKPNNNPCVKDFFSNREDIPRKLELGEKVAVRSYHGIKWLFGKIIEKQGLLHYSVKLDNGGIVRRHIDQIISIGKNVEDDTSCLYKYYIPRPSVQAKNASEKPLINTNSNVNSDQDKSDSNQDISLQNDTGTGNSLNDNVHIEHSNNFEPRRSTRPKKPVNKLNL